MGKLLDRLKAIAEGSGASIEATDDRLSEVINKIENSGGGSSDFGIAQLKLVDAIERGSGQQTAITIHCIVAAEDAIRRATLFCPVNGEITIPIPLYKGKNISITPDDLIGATSMPTLSGGIAYSETDEMFAITGDCTITIS